MFNNKNHYQRFLALIKSIIILIFPIISFSKSNYKLNEIPDHAPLHSKHDSKAERFGKKRFKDSGEFSLIKMKEFLKRLKD